MSNKRAAIYARVSDDAQRDNYSIPTQIADCQGYAAARGYVIVGDRYVDPITGQDVAANESAILAFVDDYTSTVAARPIFDEVLQYLERVGFDVLIVHALDRLARDPFIRRTLEIEVERQGARVEYVLGNYEDSPEGEVRKDLDATFAKWENAKRVERSLRGKRGKALRGLFVGGRAPYAYSIELEAFGGLVVNSTEAEVVRQIYHLFVLERRSLHYIAGFLTEKRIPTPSGKSKWGKSTVRRILTNTTYIGECFYNKHKRRGKRLEVRDRDDWMMIKTTPIIERAIFEEAQRILDENCRTVRRAPKRFYLLSGMIFCKDCGRLYVSNAKKAGNDRRASDGLSYRHRVRQGHCRNHWISARILEPLVWNEIIKLLLDPENLKRGYTQSLEQEQARHKMQISHLATLRQAIVKLDERQKNLTAAYIDPDLNLSKDEYMLQRNQIDSERKQVKADIEALEKELASVPSKLEFETLEAFSAEVRKSLNNELNLTPEEKRRVLELLHIKVFLGHDRDVRLEGWFVAEPSGWLSGKTC